MALSVGFPVPAFKYVVLLWWDGGDWKSRTTLVLESYRRPCSSWLGGPTGWKLAKPVELPIFNVNVNRLKHYHERVLILVIPLPNDRWKSIVNFMLRNVFFACLFFTSVCTYIQTTHWFFFWSLIVSHSTYDTFGHFIFEHQSPTNKWNVVCWYPTKPYQMH